MVELRQKASLGEEPRAGGSYVAMRVGEQLQGIARTQFDIFDLIHLRHAATAKESCDSPLPERFSNVENRCPLGAFRSGFVCTTVFHASHYTIF